MPHLEAHYLNEVSGAILLDLEDLTRTRFKALTAQAIAKLPRIASRPVIIERSLYADQTLQRDGVADGVAATVVVEVDEHLAIHGLPLADAVRPPAQVII
jgi:hypothetical protein